MRSYESLLRDAGGGLCDMHDIRYRLERLIDLARKDGAEQVEQEPVAWINLHKELGKLRWMGGDEGWDNAINAVRDRLIELATSHPVRTKDLTDDELREIHHLDQFGLFCDYDDFEQIARAVIAADREKNK